MDRDLCQESISVYECPLEEDEESDGPTFPDDMSPGSEIPMIEDHDTKEWKSEQEGVEIDPAKLDVKIVDQTWDAVRHHWHTDKTGDITALEDGDKPEEAQPCLTIYRQFLSSMSGDETVNISVRIQSRPLIEILRPLFRDVKSVSLRAAKPKLKFETLYLFLPEMRQLFETLKASASVASKHLIQLIEVIEKVSAPTTEELTRLLPSGEITYDLLWALFKPNEPLFTIDHNSEQPRCALFDHGEESSDNTGRVFWQLASRSIRYQADTLSELQRFLEIDRFPGVRKISTLKAFPLAYHADAQAMRAELTERGRKFVTLTGIHHCQFDGLAFYRSNLTVIKMHMTGRTIIDAAAFAEYSKSPHNGLSGPADPELSVRRYDLRQAGIENRTVFKRVLDIADVPESALYLCDPSAQGFNLDRRMWAEFSVIGIHDIAWSKLPFEGLVLQTEKKTMLKSLVEQATLEIPQDSGERPFDDIVESKGQGLVVLLHGTPGTGKTLTAEAVSEHLRRPLFRITAGDLDSNNPSSLEKRLSETLDLAQRWKAVTLLDEADVFVESRTMHGIYQNSLVSIFLRQLEYFHGVLILTTNRVTVFDDAIKSRIHLGIKYDELDKKARARIWSTFIARADETHGDSDSSGNDRKSTVTAKEIDELAQRRCNGRQIKNTIRIAHALASSKSKQLSYDDLMTALRANEEFDTEHRNLGLSGNAANSYM